MVPPPTINIIVGDFGYILDQSIYNGSTIWPANDVNQIMIANSIEKARAEGGYYLNFKDDTNINIECLRNRLPKSGTINSSEINSIIG